MKKIKFIKRQDSGFKLSYGNSGETSLNLSNEIFDFLSQGTLNPGEEREIAFKIYKEDCIKAMSFIIMKLPLYKTSSNYSSKVDNCLELFGELYSRIESFFEENKEVEYKVNLLYRTDGRIYLKRLRVDGFSIRDYLVENYSALQFDDERGGMFNLRVLSNIEDDGSLENEEIEEILDVEEEELLKPLQQIFYGAPGTGKSHEVKKYTETAENEGRVFRTTFHPDSDYSTFVGCYKPTMTVVPKTTLIGTKVVEVENGAPEEKITYHFTPQAFTNAYVKAWSTEEPVFLVIEEINRGNCAQIFGDLFQLLDRGADGTSEYPVDADTDLANHIGKALAASTRDDFPAGVKEGSRLVLPKNLYIWATMNTSDQSLFPIDSAFKRRWEWRYMPIEDAAKGWKIAVNGKEYDWYRFLEAINKEVLELTHSEDKQLGYFFAKAKDNRIDAQTLVNKVYFYLWTDVFKDYDYESQKAFKKAGGNETIAFKDFFTHGGVDEAMADQVLVNLGIEPIPLEANPNDDDYGDRSGEKMVVTLNGERIEGDNPSSTFVTTLQKIGLEKLVGRGFDGSVLVTTERNGNVKTRQIGQYYINTGLWPAYKKRWLQAAARELNLDLTVE